MAKREPVSQREARRLMVENRRLHNKVQELRNLVEARYNGVGLLSVRVESDVFACVRTARRLGFVVLALDSTEQDNVVNLRAVNPRLVEP